MPPTRSQRSSAKQTRLEFFPLSSSSPAERNQSNGEQNRLANVRYGDGYKRRPSIDSESRGIKNLPPTPQPSSQPDATSPKVLTDPALHIDACASSASSPLSGPPSSPDPLPNEVRNQISRHKSDVDDEEVQNPSSKRRKLRNSDVASFQNKPTPSRKSARLQSHSQPLKKPAMSSPCRPSIDASKTPSPARVLFKSDSAESSDDDHIMATAPLYQRKQKQIKKICNEFEVPDDVVEYITSEDEEPSVRASTRRRELEDSWIVDNDEGEQTTELTPRDKQGFGKHSSSSRRRRSRREQRELEEDLENLQDSESAMRVARTRGGPVTTQRDNFRKHLDVLKRRRAGERIRRVEDSSEEEFQGVDMEYVGQDLNTDDLELDAEPAHSTIETKPVAPGSGVDDDNFISDDSADRLELPHPDIPLEFTRFAKAKPRELFVDLIEWLVKNKIAPAFNREDQIYKLSRNKIGDELAAQAGSRLISASWNSTFRHAILARPGIKVTPLPGLDEDNIRTCDACNRSNHPATYDFVLKGEPYFHKTLEPVEKSESEDDSYNEDDDTASKDSQGHILASQSQHFYLGRFCAANAEMGHKVTHWLYHLNQNLLAYLEEQGILSAEAIVAREKMNKKKREKEAEAIVKNMDEIGMVAQLWGDLKNDLDDARLGMEGFEKKGGRSKGRIGTIRTTADDGTVREWREDRYREVPRAESDSEG